MIRTIVKNMDEGRTFDWLYDPDADGYGKWLDAGQIYEVDGGYPLPPGLMEPAFRDQMVYDIKEGLAEVTYQADNTKTLTEDKPEKKENKVPKPAPEKAPEAKEPDEEILTNRADSPDEDVKVSEHDRKASELRKDISEKGRVEATLEDIKYEPQHILKDPSGKEREKPQPPKEFDINKYREGLIDKKGNPTVEPSLRMKKSELQRIASRFHIEYSRTDTKQTLVDRIEKRINQ